MRHPNRFIVLSLSLFFSFSVWAGGGGQRNSKVRYRSKGKKVYSSVSPRKLKPKGVASPAAIRAKSANVLSFDEAIRFKNISIVPVSTSDQGPFENYTLLEEGLAQKTLTIRELKGNSHSAEVSEVEVRNKGEYPVYFLGGEMILGGKQDRIIQADTVIENDKNGIA